MLWAFCQNRCGAGFRSGFREASGIFGGSHVGRRDGIIARRRLARVEAGSVTVSRHFTEQVSQSFLAASERLRFSWKLAVFTLVVSHLFPAVFFARRSAPVTRRLQAPAKQSMFSSESTTWQGQNPAAVFQPSHLWPLCAGAIPWVIACTIWR